MKNNTGKQYNIWWGPPKKFSTKFEDRKISWLELFYDLVYVIVISRTTHHLAVNPGAQGILDYLLLFVMIFWGWFNGSMYHDLHGSQGIRTRFMTLWQMMAVAALAVALNSPAVVFTFRVTIALIFLQVYITYLWWSVGIYDKNHRKLNVPYTLCYLVALILISVTLFVHQPYKRILFGIALIFNYMPPFLTGPFLGRKHLNLSLSPSMVERLGLFTIILFGEVILGVINGTSEVETLDNHVWICFGMGILVVFALWWIFFSLIADREIKSGFLNGQIMSMFYILTLGSLGIVGATFAGLIDTLENQVPHEHSFLIKSLFGISLSVFLVSIWAISKCLCYPKEYNNSKKILSTLVISAAIAILLITFLFENLAFSFYLGFTFSILLVIIITITQMWFKVEVNRVKAQEEKR